MMNKAKNTLNKMRLLKKKKLSKKRKFLGLILTTNQKQKKMKKKIKKMTIKTARKRKTFGIISKK